jgi:hypothetical protein
MTISKALVVVIALTSAACGAAVTAIAIPTRSDVACVPAPEGAATTIQRIPPERGGSKEY